jgi:hypothetical protein
MFINRLAAIGMVLALSTGNLAVCGGWEATPEARMACCADGATCPMHQSGSHDSGSTHVLSQAQADSCCAMSEPNDSATTTRSASLLPGTLAVAPSPVPVILTVLDSSSERRDPLVPLPLSPVPRHLLLSVFLV